MEPADSDRFPFLGGRCFLGAGGGTERETVVVGNFWTFAGHLYSEYGRRGTILHRGCFLLDQSVFGLRIDGDVWDAVHVVLVADGNVG